MANKGSSLPNGESLGVGDYLLSQDGTCQAILQGDGNFVLYQGTRVWWATDTNQTSPVSPNVVFMQTDGNLVMYKSTGGQALWASNVGFGPDQGPYTLTLANYGNLIVTDGKGQVTWSSRGVARGSTLTSGQFLSVGDFLLSPNALAQAVFQQTGTFLVMNNKNGQTLWSNGITQPVVHGSYILFMQEDGNLVEYRSVGAAALWESGSTHGTTQGPYSLVMQNDGNLVVYQPGGHAIWASNTSVPTPAPTPTPQQGTVPLYLSPNPQGTRITCVGQTNTPILSTTKRAVITGITNKTGEVVELARTDAGYSTVLVDVPQFAPNTTVTTFNGEDVAGFWAGGDGTYRTTELGPFEITWKAV